MSVEQLKDLKRVAVATGEMQMLDKLNTILSSIETKNSIEKDFLKKVLNELERLKK